MIMMWVFCDDIPVKALVEDSKNNRSYISHNFESIKENLKIANLFYESSFSSIKEIPFSFRFAILIARRLYRQIGYKIIEKRNIDNYNNSGKIYVNNFGKIFQTILKILRIRNFTQKKI